MASSGSTSRKGNGVSATAERLASRASRSSLQRQAMPGGGEVFTGDVASRALKAVGARAMTVDRSIIVSDEFDASKPEDQALFAHEQYHLEHSGGEGTNESRDAEEIGARAVERMVLHRARAGGPESHEANHAVPQTNNHGAAGPHEAKSKKQETETAAQRGYQALRDAGYAHADVVAHLGQEIMRVMDHQKQANFHRLGDKKGFL
jgi:hypothetical protein